MMSAASSARTPQPSNARAASCTCTAVRSAPVAPHTATAARMAIDNDRCRNLLVVLGVRDWSRDLLGDTGNLHRNHRRL